ncbi:UNVERIFIED_CONTAM: hypothetical protein GTU68_023213 [Idotea baltica]|nr:hypothetical protein [Idotea baltica]
MGKELYETNDLANEFFETANTKLGYSITDLMFEGDKATLRLTKYAQPAIYLNSIIIAKTRREFNPEMVAGHSLGEITALVACRALSFGDGLKLVAKRGELMQRACENSPSTMGAVLGLEDEQVEEVLAGIKEEIIVPANYNTRNQLVISGTLKGMELATEALMEAGARRVIKLNVAGAYHSPIMDEIVEEYAQALDSVTFKEPRAAVYQNVQPHDPVSDPGEIKANLLKQVNNPVYWKQTIEQMFEDGARKFIEIGPKPVLTSMVRSTLERDITTSWTNIEEVV